jgi:hypothetical protein
MNVRTCQLCGKPLSRLRVGGDGDFCSKEHRNQSRLRKGMDRLAEVDKVASLMRRRENPRHIAPAQLMCNSALSRRGFFESKTVLLTPEPGGFTPRLPGPAAPRIGRNLERSFPPRAARLSGGSATRRSHPGLIQITGSGQSPEIPQPERPMRARVAQAPILAIECRFPMPASVPREYGMQHPRGGRVHLGELPSVLSSPEPRESLALRTGLNLRPIPSAALEGNALRVSIAVGFTLPRKQLRGFAGTATRPTALVWPHQLHHRLPDVQDSTMGQRTAGVCISTRPVTVPDVPARARAAQFDFPGTLAPRNRRPAAGPKPESRTTDMTWRPSDPRSFGIALVPPPTGFMHRNGSHLFALQLAATSTNSLPHVAFKAFVPQDPVGCPTIAFEGTVLNPIAGAPTGSISSEESAAPPSGPGAASAPPIHIEEHFGNGWDNWFGGMADWLVDVAGVRTGALALLAPTMKLIDYEFEFLARIDTRSVTWVVRAAGLEEYQRCTLTAMPGAELEFTRAAVIAGQSEPTVTSPVRIPGKPRSAMTLRMQVAGSTFTATMDGKVIDQWNDDRLSVGGIGFKGEPDDRARLYWVRLSETQSTTSKEYQIR